MFQGSIDLDAAMPVTATAIPDVLFERGLYWSSGRSGVVNLVAAHKWFNLAAVKGRADAIQMRREVAANLCIYASNPDMGNGNGIEIRYAHPICSARHTGCS